jgi:hypothetical protein
VEFDQLSRDGKADAKAFARRIIASPKRVKDMWQGLGTDASPRIAHCQHGCGPRAVEKEKWRNLLLTKAHRR